MEKEIEKQKLSWQGMTYSIQRMDLLIVSISGAGIYICLETLKYLADNKLDISLIIRISGGFFLFAIVINFISQMFGYQANRYDFLMREQIISSGKKTSRSEQCAIEAFDRKSDFYSKWTTILNYLSIMLMLLGLVLLMWFFLFIF